MTLYVVRQVPGEEEMNMLWTADEGDAVLLLQDAVYVEESLPGNVEEYSCLRHREERGLVEDEVTGQPLNYGEIIDLLEEHETVVSL